MKTEKTIMNNKRIIRVLLAAAMILLLCGAFSGAAAAYGEKTIPETGGYLESGPYKLTADVTLTTDNLIVTDGIVCTIDLNGFVLKGNGNGPVITIEGTGSLTITDSNPGKEHRFSADPSGVWTLDPRGDNVVKGGIITGGSAEQGGAVFLDDDATELILNGGTIVGNQATGSGGGIYVYCESSKVIIDGGNLIGNVSGTSGSGAGGALYTKGAVILKDGTISYNTSGTNGGGIYLSTGGSLVMENGNITYNTSGRNGGGVAVFSREASIGFVMNGGEISHNTISGFGNCGGGVAVYNNSTFTMNGGTIEDNTALDDACGGGIGAESSDGSGTIILNGGTITGNCSDGPGSGIYIGTNGCRLMVSGSPYVKNNVNPDGSRNNIQAAAPENIILAGKLDDAALLYVSIENEEGDYVFAAVDETYAAAASIEELAADAARFRFEGDGAPGYVVVSGKLLKWGTVYTVSFDTQGYGTPAPADQRIHQNGHAAEPLVIEPGRTLSGWYTDDKFTTKWDFNSDRVASDITLYAKWDPAHATLSPECYDTAKELVDAIADPAVAVLASTEKPNDTVKLTSDLYLNKPAFAETELNFGNAYTVTGAKKIYLDLNGHVLKQTSPGSVIQIWNDTELVIIDSNPKAEHRFTVNDDGLWVLDEFAKTDYKVVKGGVITGGKGGEGGGILIVNGNSKLTMNAGNIVGNRAVNGNGGGGGVSTYFADESLPDGEYSFTMNGGTIQGNVSPNKGGGVRINQSALTFSVTGGLIANNTAVTGGGICTYGALILNPAKGKEIKITGNRAIGYGDNGAGGGIFCWNNEVVITNGVEISGNIARGNGGGGIGIEGPASTLSMMGGTVADNIAEPLDSYLTDYVGMGGGIRAANGAFVWVSGGKITGNETKGFSSEYIVSSGGGIAAIGHETNIGIDNAEISHNKETSNGGGGIWIGNGASGTMIGGTVAYNTAVGNGGGIDLNGQAEPVSFFMMGGSIHDNTADHSGGGIAVLNNSKLRVSGTSKISGNTGLNADGGNCGIGGGIFAWNNSEVSILDDVIISENTAWGRGGAGVCIEDSTLNLVGGQIINNINIDGKGAGIFLIDGDTADLKSTLKVSGSPVIKDNWNGKLASNIDLPGSRSLILTGPLGLSAEIHITSPASMVAELFGLVDEDYVAHEEGDVYHFVSDTPSPVLAAKWEGPYHLSWVAANKIETGSAVRHGTITTLPISAAVPGTMVTLTITPDAGYYFVEGSLKGTYPAADTNGNEVKEIVFTKLSRNVYTFIMPDAPVTITASFTSAAKSSSSQGSSILLTETPIPTPTPTETPTPAPVPGQEVPAVKPTAQPTQTPASPAPVLGILAGLGAAAVLFLRRE